MADVESNNSQQATDQAGAGMADPKADPDKAITETEKAIRSATEGICHT